MSSSPPSRGAWIEIVAAKYGVNKPESPPSRGAWIEIVTDPVSGGTYAGSPPSRGAWIEIPGPGGGQSPARVAPLAGGVD